jgi:PAS domain S-box-containing protein
VDTTETVNTVSAGFPVPGIPALFYKKFRRACRALISMQENKERSGVWRGFPNLSVNGPVFAELFTLLLVFCSYLAAGKLMMGLVKLNPDSAVIWVPSGIALAAFLLKGPRVWPAVFLGSILVSYPAQTSLLVALGVAAGNTLEAFLGAYLVKKFANGTKAFSSLSGVLRFSLLAAVLCTLLNAVISVSLISAAGTFKWSEFSYYLLRWSLADAVAILVVTPFLVLLLEGSHPPLSWAESIEAGTLLLGLSFVCVLIFGPPTFAWTKAAGPEFFAVPFLVWVVFRFCPLEASGAGMLISGFATWGSLHGYGPFAANPEAPLVLATYLLVLSAMVLAASAAVSQQRATAEDLLQSICLTQQVKDSEIRVLNTQIAALQRMSERKDRRSSESVPSMETHDEVLWFLDAETEHVLYLSPAYETVWGRSRQCVYEDPHAWIDPILPEDKERALIFLDPNYAGDRVESTYRIRRPDGTIRWIFDQGYILRDEAGRPFRLVGLATDITDRKRTNSKVSTKPGQQQTHL